MQKKKVVAVFSGLMLVAGVSGLLAGCGNSEYESPDEFLSGISLEKQPGDEDLGTMPPLGESMDKVAKIRLETTKLELGVVANDDFTRHQLKVYNDGEMPLRITKIDTTCACTTGTVTPENSLVQAKGESWIDVVIDPRRIPGFHSHKVLTITSTDPEQMFTEVDVFVDVDPEYEVGPTDIELGDVEKGKAFEHRVRFRQLIDEKVDINELLVLRMGLPENVDLGMEAEVVDVPESEWQTAGKQEFDLVFTFDDSLPVGPFVRYARLFADTKRGFPLRLNFTGTVIAPYSVDPAFPPGGQLGKVEGGDTSEVEFTFSAATPIVLQGITPSSERLSVKTLPASSNNEVKLLVTYDGKLQQGIPFSGNVSVSLDVNGSTYTEDLVVYLPVVAAAAAASHEGHNH